MAPVDRTGIARRGDREHRRHHPAGRDRTAWSSFADAGRLAIRLRDFAARRPPDGRPAARAGHAGDPVRHVRAPHVARRDLDARLRNDGRGHRLCRAFRRASRIRAHLRAERSRRQYRSARNHPDRTDDRIEVAARGRYVLVYRRRVHSRHSRTPAPTAPRLRGGDVDHAGVSAGNRGATRRLSARCPCPGHVGHSRVSIPGSSAGST